MKKLSAAIGVCALVCVLLVPAQAQVVKKAQVGFRFLENPVSAEVIGRGSAGVTTARNAFGLFWNPSLTALDTASVDIGLHYTKGIADINYSAAAVTFQLEDFAVFGFSLLMMDYGDFYGTRRALNDAGYEETGVFSPKSYAVGFNFSQKMSDRFTYGIHVKYARQDLGEAYVGEEGTVLGDSLLNMQARGYKQNALAVDIGTFYDFHYKGITFGAVLQNISWEYKYEQEKFPLPFAVSFGATIEPLLFFGEENRDQRLVVTIESRHPRDFKEKYKLGAEYTLLGQFIVRTGYMSNYDERGWSFGAGFRQSLGDFPLRLDYAYQPFGIFGSVHHLTIGFSY